MNRIFSFYLATAYLFGGSISYADTFGSGANSFQIDFVTIGNANNLADTTGQPNPAGSVPYSYRIGKYEISEQMIDKANAEAAAAGNPLGITKDTRGPDKPATSVDWFEAAKFVNWLNTSSGGSPAYKFDGDGNFQLWQPTDVGYNPANLYRNTLASYFLPSMNEWYKSAYNNPASGTYFDYPTGSNGIPTAVSSGTVPGTAIYRQGLQAGPADIMSAGGLSPYGTMAQGGNVVEWEETEGDLINDSISNIRGRRGGNWDSLASDLSVSSRAGGFPSISLNGSGFRVASIVPEPSTLLLSGVWLLSLLGGRPARRRRSHF